MLISRSEAARQLGLSKQRIDQLLDKKPYPSFLIKDVRGKYKVETNNPEWKSLVMQHKVENKSAQNKQYTTIKNKLKKVKKEKKSDKRDAPADKPDGKVVDVDELTLQTAIAQKKKMIHQARLMDERANQAEIKTLVMRKELAPLDMVKHYYSFGENLIRRIYGRVYEISPDIKSLYYANQDAIAVEKIRRELKAIITNSYDEMLADMEKEKIATKKLLDELNARRKAMDSN
jgi:hypothetical protein